jgi:excinuclease ABC subunit C
MIEFKVMRSPKMPISLQEQVKNLPTQPGVYMMKDGEGTVLYIGKARDLRHRVQTYFQNRVQSAKIEALLSKAKEIDFIETQTEVDALLLESQLVNKMAPRYNTRLKDDKSFPLLKITGDRFPMIRFTRERKDKKAAYYGPFTDAGLLREAVRVLNTVFPLRKCMKLPKKACLYYHIGQCLAPCIKPEVKEQYDDIVKEVQSFIGGGKKTLVEYLSGKMVAAAKELRFEEAQFYKEQIQALNRLKRKRYDRRYELAGVSLSATAELRRILGLRKFPERIVCFDVSNIAGREAVGSRVSFYYEMPDKNEYRRYRIRTVVGIDDYAMIQETLQRMLRGIREGKEAFLPDLIVIDGGKGHLNSAYEIMKKEGFEEVALISIAKQFEFLYTLDSKDPIILPENSKALHLLKKIRDEAHRFAITYHRKLHTELMSQSILDQIDGVGEKRKMELFRHFSSIDQIRKASPEEIAKLRGFNRQVAMRVLAYLREDPALEER